MALITPLVFKQSSPFILEGYPAPKSTAGDAPVYFLTPISLLIINNFTDTNEAKGQDRVSANFSQEFPGKTCMALPKYLVLL